MSESNPGWLRGKHLCYAIPPTLILLGQTSPLRENLKPGNISLLYSPVTIRFPEVDLPADDAVLLGAVGRDDVQLAGLVVEDEGDASEVGPVAFCRH